MELEEVRRTRTFQLELTEREAEWLRNLSYYARQVVHKLLQLDTNRAEAIPKYSAQEALIFFDELEDLLVAKEVRMTRLVNDLEE